MQRRVHVTMSGVTMCHVGGLRVV